MSFFWTPFLKFCAPVKCLIPLTLLPALQTQNLCISGDMNTELLHGQSTSEQEPDGKLLCSKMDFTFRKFQMLFETKSDDMM